VSTSSTSSVKDAELRDNPPADPDDVHPLRDYGGQRHLHDEDLPEIHDLLGSWRRILDSVRRADDGRRSLSLRTPSASPATTASTATACRWRSTSAFLWCP
jgi:hypothetical protein